MDNPEYTKTLEPYASWVNRSKSILAPLVSWGSIRSALDLGCNCGPWLAALNELGVNDVIGVNDLEIWDNILFDRSRAVIHDLSRPLELRRRFDLVLCLEVAEHIGEGDAGAEQLIKTITKHGDKVLFSAATPGQWGDGHVNCQPHGYWHALFEKNGFQVWDTMRPVLRERSDTEDWYKANMFIYTRSLVGRDSISSREELIKLEALELISPFAYRPLDTTDEEWTFYVRCAGSRNYDDVRLLSNRLPILRALYPGARIVVSAPWDSLQNSVVLKKAANGCDCVTLDPAMHMSTSGSACLSSMLEVFLEKAVSRYLVKFDPDTLFHYRLSPPNCSGVHGCPETLTDGGDVVHPANLQGGCLLYTRDAAEALLKRARMEDQAYWSDYAGTWAKGVKDWLNHGENYGILDDAVSRHACLIAGVPMCVHPEILSYYTPPPTSNWWQGFAATHPHKN